MSDLQGSREDQGMRAEECGLSRTQLSILIDDWIFSERDRAILKRRLVDGICYEPLAEEFNLSVRQVKSIIYREQDKLFKHLKF